jgi:phage terminase large subunit-like protein
MSLENIILCQTVISNSKRFEEINKCGNDPKYFIKNYIKISHPTKGLVKFDLFPYQEECLDNFITHKKIIVNKSRQLGLSTITAAYSLWMAIFHRERNILVIATKLDVAKNFLRKVRANFDGLPDWLVLPSIVGNSTKYLQFSNGSQIKAIATSQDAARSESLSLVILDECVSYNTNIKIRNKLTNEEMCITISELYEQLHKN